MAEIAVSEITEIQPAATVVVPMVADTDPLTLDKIRASKECK